MALETGKRLGSYEILAPLGAGGMGEVYRARDGKLGREVAVKVLPDEFAQHPEKLARFEREARLLAGLNHSGIATLYGVEQVDGRLLLAMELVAGETLAERLSRGPIPVDEALPIARQIAEALEAAHEKGVIHRDLKPANVKVDGEGRVKLLDFGLAKALVEEEPDGDLSQSPTLSHDTTRAGIILGTAAYMSPEQARGKPVDRRADIWAFGVVFLEMVTGKKVFQGEDVSLTLSSVLQREPDWEELPGDVPPSFASFLRPCLAKDPKRRVRDIGDVRLALEGAFETAGDATPSQPLWRSALPIAAGAFVVGGMLVGGLMWSRRPDRAAPPVTRTAIPLSRSMPLSLGGGQYSVLALSPDGRRVVYRVMVNGQPALVVHPLDSLEASVLQEGNVQAPFFSPNGEWVGFAAPDPTDYAIKRIPVAGGPALTVCPIPGDRARILGASWGEDGAIVFGTLGSSGLWRVPATGGTPEPLTTLDEAGSEINHEYPELLPGGRAVLFTIRRAAEAASQADIAVLDLESGEQRVLVSGGSDPTYVPTGHLLYGFGDSLRAVRFDLDRLAVVGSPAEVLPNVVATSRGAIVAATARDGSLVYMAGESPGASRTLVWVDRQGREEPLPVSPRAYLYPRLSPDGTRVALDVRDEENDIWVWDLARASFTRLTFDPGLDRAPEWSPDGRHIAFSSEREGTPDLFWIAADGTGAVERLSEGAGSAYPTSFTPDGATLIYWVAPGSIAALDLQRRRAQTLIETRFPARGGTVSPDGRWLAYESDETGQKEIYVRPFPDVEAQRWPVSTGGGHSPLWARSGEEMFYRALDGSLMRAEIRGGPTFEVGTPSRLFQGDYERAQIRNFDISPNGQRFLMVKDLPTDETDAPDLILIQNWHEELKRLLPVD